MVDILGCVGEGEQVLLVWSDLGTSAHQLPALLTSLQQRVGQHGRVSVENAERLTLSGHAKSSFSQIFSNMIGIPSWRHETDFLGHLLTMLAPNGTLHLVEADEKSSSSLRSRLVLSGFVNVGDPEEIFLPSLSEQERAKLGSSNLIKMKAQKPSFEVGASQPLSFAKKPQVPVVPKANVWTLEDLEDETVELIDESSLVEEADLAKPDPASLRVCGTTGKKKACKDCSCGLKEELEAGVKPTTKSATSSCGSCYLGDAFRCASCPYLGMPAFKPGEKIQLSDRQLNPDLKAQ